MMSFRALVAVLTLLGVGAEPEALTASSSASAVALSAVVVARVAGPSPLALDADDGGANDDDDAGDAETGSGPAVLSVEGVLQALKGALLSQLHVPEYQWVNALVAFILGAVLVLDGDRAFRWIMLVAVFFLVQLLARYEVEQAWKLEPLSAKSRFVGVVAGLSGVLAAFRGMEGMLLSVAALFGTLVAYMGQSFFVSQGYDCWSSNQWLLVVWYSVLIQTCVILWGIKKHKGILGVVTPFLGAPLVVSAMSWLLTVMALQENWLGGVSPEKGAWVDFLVLLVSSTSDDKGLFAHSPYNFAMTGQVYRTDRILGCVFWALIFAVGVIVQLRSVKKARAESRKRKSKGHLSQGLLEELGSSVASVA